MIGWAMFYTGNRKKQETQQKIFPEDDPIKAMLMAPGEPEQREA